MNDRENLAGWAKQQVAYIKCCWLVHSAGAGKAVNKRADSCPGGAYYLWIELYKQVLLRTGFVQHGPNFSFPFTG